MVPNVIGTRSQGHLDLDSNFGLSERALSHRCLLVYLLILCGMVGLEPAERAGSTPPSPHFFASNSYVRGQGTTDRPL